MARFACVDDRDIKDLIDDKDSENTKRKDRHSVQCLPRLLQGVLIIDALI